ncbi:MAG: hypothetical protein H0Z37_02035 [Firmicutes bacterium]|nr:hypothetical protein [Bacillota bacterium]
MDTTMLLYRLLALLIAVGCAAEVLTQRKLRDQVTAAVVMIPLVLRALLIK